MQSEEGGERRRRGSSWAEPWGSSSHPQGSSQHIAWSPFFFGYAQLPAPGTSSQDRVGDPAVWSVSTGDHEARGCGSQDSCPREIFGNGFYQSGMTQEFGGRGGTKRSLLTCPGAWPLLHQVAPPSRQVQLRDQPGPAKTLLLLVSPALSHCVTGADSPSA